MPDAGWSRSSWASWRRCWTRVPRTRVYANQCWTLARIAEQVVERGPGCLRGRQIPALCALVMSAVCPRGVCAGWRRHRADGGMRRPSRCLLAECAREGRVALGGASAHGRGERG